MGGAVITLLLLLLLEAVTADATGSPDDEDCWIEDEVEELQEVEEEEVEVDEVISMGESPAFKKKHVGNTLQ